MIIDNKIQQIIDNALIAEDKERSKEHVSSGLLSASMLYQPLRFQVMKTIGVPAKAQEAYSLGKFKRGNDVEDWYVNQLEKAGLLIARQAECKYRGAIGYVDAIVNPESLNFKECFVHEIKSVVNSKLKYVVKTGEADYHYRLQGTFYAMARGERYYAVDIISAEDLRIKNFIYDIRDTQKDVDEIISKYDRAMEAWKKNKVLPPFEVHPMVKWTSNFEYAPFAVEHCNMTDEQIIELVK